MNLQNSRLRNILSIAFMAMIFYVLWSMFQPDNSQKVENINFNEFVSAVEQNKVQSVTIVGDKKIAGQYKDKRYFATLKERNFLLATLLSSHKDIKFNIVEEKESVFWSIVVSWLPIILLIVIAVWFFKGVMKSNQNFHQKYGKAKTYVQEGGEEKTFEDVAGIDEVKEEVQEVVDFLKKRKSFNLLGGRVPRGVLLLGPSGVGKTLLARAIAGEAQVPFLSMSGSGFVEMFVGVGAARVRDLFEQARKQAPCIIFIDEIDAVGRQRGAGMGGGNDEREQTLNQLLIGMDGFEANSGIILIAATNRPDVLDNALLRAGRFDRKIYVPRPDINGRLAILKVHARNKKMAASVDLMTIARGTNGMTGADLENILNEAALLAGRQDKKEIETADIEAAKEKVLVGKKRSVKIIEEEKKVIAVHESGHALVHLACSRFDALHKVSIVPRGGALGLTWSLPVEDRHLLSRKQADDMILSILGGRAAEELLLGRDNITSGASNDLERATALLRQMVAHYGMDEEFGLAAFGDSSANPFLGREMALHSGMSQGMQEKIEKRVCVLLGDYYKKTKQILEEKSAELEKLSAALMERETLSADEVKELLATNK